MMRYKKQIPGHPWQEDNDTMLDTEIQDTNFH